MEIKIGQRFKSTGKHPRICIVIDIYKTYNSTGELFRENELPFKTAEEYQAFLAVNVLPEITEAIYVY